MGCPRRAGFARLGAGIMLPISCPHTSGMGRIHRDYPFFPESISTEVAPPPSLGQCQPSASSPDCVSNHHEPILPANSFQGAQKKIASAAPSNAKRREQLKVTKCRSPEPSRLGRNTLGGLPTQRKPRWVENPPKVYSLYASQTSKTGSSGAPHYSFLLGSPAPSFQHPINLVANRVSGFHPTNPSHKEPVIFRMPVANSRDHRRS